MLKQRGLHVGVIARGYNAGGPAPENPVIVDSNSSAAAVGDEPLMVWQRLQSGHDRSDTSPITSDQPTPVVVCADRRAALEMITRDHSLDIVLSDDGLQHYALIRAFEIVVIDGRRKFGNRRLLPIGPLREPTERLCHVDLILTNGSGGPDLDREIDKTGTPSLNFCVRAEHFLPLSTAADAAFGAIAKKTNSRQSRYLCTRSAIGNACRANRSGVRYCQPAAFFTARLNGYCNPLSSK